MYVDAIRSSKRRDCERNGLWDYAKDEYTSNLNYTYSKLNNLKEDVNGNKYIETNNEVSYNMYLYNSDYNYRIGDYKLAESYSIKNNDDTQKILKNR